MRYILTVIILLYSELCFSIGWETLNKESARTKQIVIEVKYSDPHECYTFSAELPKSVFFEGLGKRKVESVTYRVVTNREKGWQLGLEGTKISMNVTPSEVTFGSVYACLAGNEFENGVIVINTSTPKGSPPMFIVINVKDFA